MQIDTYLGTLLEFRVINVQLIYFKALPARLLVGALHWRGSSLFPRWDGLHVEVAVVSIYVCKEASLLRSVLLVLPCFFNFLKLHFLLAFYWRLLFFYLFLWFPSSSPCVKSFHEWLMGLRLIVSSFSKRLYTNHCFNLVNSPMLMLVRLEGASLGAKGVLTWSRIRELLIIVLGDWPWWNTFTVLDILPTTTLPWLGDSHASWWSGILDSFDDLQFMAHGNSHLLNVLVLYLQYGL